MVVHYRLPGVVASGALIFYALIVLALFRLIPVTLTLAGIAGFVLSVGMAVDANILIFERTKEELRVDGLLKGVPPELDAAIGRLEKLRDGAKAPARRAFSSTQQSCR